MEIRHVRETLITGLSLRTDNATEMDPTTATIGKLWQAFDNTVPVDYKKGERVYGVYFDYESDHTGLFSVLAGFNGSTFPEHSALKQVVIPEGQYLVFSHEGDMPKIAIDAWTEVWQYFANENVEQQRLYTTDFEYYPSSNKIEVHIAIKSFE
ncbi:GyrI-like domain-containing protein [Thalassotalea piscium]